MENLLSEIIDWAKDKPLFWQEAVGKILQKNILTEDDFSDLVNICKLEKGLTKYNEDLINLDQLKESLEESESADDISLIKISDTENINALKNNSEINIEETGITVIYGDNGSGKSSYVSILKQICNTRGSIPAIHQNLFLDSKEPQNQKAKVHYKSGENTDFVTWQNGESDSNILKSVHIFDTKSANSYIEDEGKIAFMPSGLLIIEKLANACNKVEEKIRVELQQSFQAFDYSFLITEESNEIQNFLGNIGSKSDLKKLEEIAVFTTDDEKLLKATESKILKLKVLDPVKKVSENSKTIDRFNILKTKYERIKKQLSSEKIKNIRTDILKYCELQNAIKTLKEKTFSDLPVIEIGSQPWKELWESARKFYEHSTNQKFPDLSDDSICPLCLQDLGDKAKGRFMNFEEFVQTDIQNQLNTVHQRLNISEEEIKNISLDFSEILSTIVELNSFEKSFKEWHNKIFIEQITNYISSILGLFTNLQKADEFVVQEINISLTITIDRQEVNINLIDVIGEIVTKIEEENKLLLEKSVIEEIKEQEKISSFLKSKKGLFENKGKIKNEIKRHKIIELLNLCLESCNTRNISLFSNSLSEKYVTDALKNNFTNELEKLDFDNIKIDTSTRGVSGKQFHSLTLDSSYGRNIHLKEILSEGEHRCISLATFLSELSICEHKSTIIFDDPVSSLDHKWRRKIAKRVVEEASERQVIVFTHDITFLMNLQEFSEEINIQSLTRSKEETGVPAQNPPWDALKTSARIGVLKDYWQQLEKIKREETEEIYKERARIFYGKLREAWERCIEEVVLNGVIERFGRAIRTIPLRKVVGFSENDYRIIDDNMNKCSTYFNGHDSAGTLIEEMQSIDEIKIDIETLENFVKEIRRRRN